MFPSVFDICSLFELKITPFIRLLLSRVNRKVQNNNMLKVVFLFSVFVLVTSEFCNIFLNEINLDDPRKPKKNEFIEIKSNCTEILSLRGYKIIGINSNTHTMATIELFVQLWQFKTGNNGYFTIGGSGVSTADQKAPSHFINYRKKFGPNTRAITNFMLGGNKYLQAIALLYGPGESLQEIALTEKRQYIDLTNDYETLVKNHLVDLVVYGRRAPRDRCDIFENLYPQFSGKRYALRDFDVEGRSDYSLNRCAVETDGFLPQKFKVANPTPGRQNDCENAVHYILEDHIDYSKTNSNNAGVTGGNCRRGKRILGNESYTNIQKN